jgi:hypothetical protein
VRKTGQEVISRGGQAWLFVSPQQTGRTSLLTYLCAIVAEREPRQSVIKIDGVPDHPSIDDFRLILKHYGSGATRTILVFDGNILAEGCVELLREVLTRSHRRLSVWATCTPEEHEKLQRKMDLQQHFLVRAVPGYVDSDRSFFNLFVNSKFAGMWPENSREQSLPTTNVTMGGLCALYVALKSGTIRIEAISSSISSRILSQFHDMPLQAQLLARMISHLGSVPEEVVQHLTGPTRPFREDDYNLVLKQQFAFVDSGMVKPTTQLREIVGRKLLVYEHTHLGEALLKLAKGEEDSVLLLQFLRILKQLSQGFTKAQTLEYHQLVRRAEGGQFCNVCGLYHPANLKWCPTCGGEPASHSEVAPENSELLRKYGLGCVPFPQAEFCNDVGRPEFVWSELDLSIFDDVDK